jgi:hypothetical protein
VEPVAPWTPMCLALPFAPPSGRFVFVPMSAPARIGALAPTRRTSFHDPREHEMPLAVVVSRWTSPPGSSLGADARPRLHAKRGVARHRNPRYGYFLAGVRQPCHDSPKGAARPPRAGARWPAGRE